MQTIKAIPVLALLILAGALSAQASTSTNGSVSDENEYWFIMDIDFGSTPNSADILLTTAATSGSSGLDVTLVDLDACAANGLFSGAADGDNDPGLGNIMLNVTSGTYTGVRQFAAIFATDSGSGTSPFMGVVTSGTLSAGAITINDSGTVPFVVSQLLNLFGRVTRWYEGTSGAATLQQEFTVDFGSTPQSVSFDTQLQAMGANASVEIYEIDTGGSPQLLGTVNATSGSYVDAVETSSTRSGAVTFRLVLIASGAGQFGIHTVWPEVTPITVPSPGSGGGGGGGGDGGGDDGGGCSTGGSQGWLLLAGLLAALGVALRSRLSGA